MTRRHKFTLIVTVLALFLMGGCASLPTDFERHESHAYMDTDDTRLGKAIQAEKPAHPNQSGFLLLGNGLDAFSAGALLAQGAERSIDNRTIGINTYGFY